MPVDHQLAALLPLLNGAPPLREGTPARARAGFRIVTVDLRDPATLASVRSSEDVTYPAAEGPRKARIYRPQVEGSVPTILFIHGGGFVMGDLDTHDDQARRLCRDTGAVVVSIDYRLAPEHPFPAGYLDAVAAMRHVFDSVDELGGDATRIGVAGDSAGGNLSAGVAIAARDEGLRLKAQLLLYPSTDFVDDDTHQSRVDNASGYFLIEDDIRWFHECYGADPLDPRASVLAHPDLSGVAPAIVATAEYDPLRDEGDAYALALEKAGVPVVARRCAGLVHGFFGMGSVSAACDQAIGSLCEDFKELLG